MSKTVEFVFCELPETPREFDIKKFKEKDHEQIELYDRSKAPRRKRLLKFEDIEKDYGPNYAREVPDDCVFIDFDKVDEAAEMYDIIVRSKIRCLILETVKGYHFLFRKPDFYKKELTKATNWFGYKFDCKGQMPGKKNPVQIMRVCGMDREERMSWDLSEPIVAPALNIETLDVLPYWLWGKLKDNELHKGGKTGDRSKDDAVTHTLTDNPFTQLMKMEEGSRHNHIVERCSYFALSNGFEMDEFKNLIQAIHDQYLVKIGIAMSDSDLFGDLPKRWEDYKDRLLISEGWDYDEKERRWKKVKEKKTGKISYQKACEFLYNKYDFYVMGCNYDIGEGGQLCYITSDLRISFDLNVMWKELRETFFEKDFDTRFYEEVKKQLIQRCNGDKKYFRRSSKYYVCKNGIASCISDDIYDFDYLKKKNLPPTDLIYAWNVHDRTWVKEHEEDLGKNITKFIRELSRDSAGVPQLEVEQWLYVITGASITPANSLGKIVVLSGGGQNGKSIYLGINKMLLSSNFYNESNIFGSSPTTKYWGDGLDKGISCIIDELPQNYNKEAFSYIKGGVSRTASVEINPKYGKKKLIEILPQIICATNHKFELFDKSFGMRRRVAILPCCYKVSNEEKDKLLLYKIVMNLEKNKESDEKVTKYRMNEETENAGIVIEESGIHIREQCVIESLENGSLCWFVNKCRYMYIDYILGKLPLSNSEEMENLFDETFGDDRRGQIKQFINCHIVNKCGTDKTRDLSLANCYIKELFDEHKQNCKIEKIEAMEEKSFSTICGKVLKELGYTTKRKKKGTFVFFDKKVAPSKKK